MFHFCHLVIVTAYLACPVLVLAHGVRARRRDGRSVPLRRFGRAVVGGTAVGLLVCVAYAVAAHVTAGSGFQTYPQLLAGVAAATGRTQPRVGQVAVTAYLATSFMLLLGLGDRWLWRATQAAFRLAPGRPPGPMFGARVTGALLLRAAVVGGLGIPYVLAVALTFRPKASPTTDPGRLCGWAYESVSFPAAVDATPIAGWWIPAPGGGGAARTLVLCPGALGGRAAVLPLARSLRDDGYNVLTFDFRGHGDSGGQLVSYGDLERRDVLGAVRWLQQAHPDAARDVVGVGVSTGAAALLAAAADPSPAGQAIEAVAVYAPFDRLDHALASDIPPYAPPPLAWLARHVALPLAGLQVGADLPAFSPADAAAALWPRPVLVIHGMDDEVVPFAEGQAVYDAASEPKQALFIGKCNHAEALDDAAAQRAVERYFKTARRLI